MASNYYQESKEMLSGRARENYQNLSEEEKKQKAQKFLPSIQEAFYKNWI